VASESITIRFPSGAWEYAVTERVPELGDTLVRDEKTWAVAAVAESVDDHRVIIMALSPRGGEGVLAPEELGAMAAMVEKESSHLKNSARWPRWG
jgi:hypothetical protein